MANSHRAHLQAYQSGNLRPLANNPASSACDQCKLGASVWNIRPRVLNCMELQWLLLACLERVSQKGSCRADSSLDERFG